MYLRVSPKLLSWCTWSQLELLPWFWTSWSQKPVVEIRLLGKRKKVLMLRSITFLEVYCVTPTSLLSLPSPELVSVGEVWQLCYHGRLWLMTLLLGYLTHFSSHSGPFQWWLARHVCLAMESPYGKGQSPQISFGSQSRCLQWGQDTCLNSCHSAPGFSTDIDSVFGVENAEWQRLVAVLKQLFLTSSY